MKSRTTSLRFLDMDAANRFGLTVTVTVSLRRRQAVGRPRYSAVQQFDRECHMEVDAAEWNASAGTIIASGSYFRQHGQVFTSLTTAIHRTFQTLPLWLLPICRSSLITTIRHAPDRTQNSPHRLRLTPGNVRQPFSLSGRWRNSAAAAGGQWAPTLSRWDH